MDLDLEHRINAAIQDLKKISNEDIDFHQMDPVARMMLVALLNETQKIHDQINKVGEQIEDRYCTDFIPRDKIEAVPAITVLSPSFRPKKDLEAIQIGSGAVFTYKKKEEERKTSLNYIPLFNTLALPYSKLFLLSHNRFSAGEQAKTISMGHANQLWLGISTKVELNSLYKLPLLIEGTHGIHPEHIYVGSENRELDFANMRKMEDMAMAEPFDSQQASEQFFSFFEIWKDGFFNLDNALMVVVTDKTDDRDLFKPQPFPREFQQWLENDILDEFRENSLWLRIVFPEGYTVPDQCRVIPNAFPVVNVDVCSLTLSPSSPIAKLQKQENSFFLRVLETSTSSQTQGFPKTTDEVIIRDFDASCYHNGDLFRDIRSLYNRFIDDYHAFTEYNNIKDGETLRQLRDSFNKLGKSAKEENPKYKFDSGTYVMRNLKYPGSTAITKVSYITTQGATGNSPRMGETMENKKLPTLEPNIPVVVSAICGADKATADVRYELLRYYTLTNDRLFSRMDVEAFLRKEIMVHFGSEEFKRIMIKTSIEGSGGETSLRRGLYVDIEFKDKKNYDKAVALSLEKKMLQKIENKSCISMPIILRLINLENKNA